MFKIISNLDTYIRLGVGNLFQALAFRVFLKLGFFSYLKNIQISDQKKEYFTHRSIKFEDDFKKDYLKANFKLFGWKEMECEDQPPDWHKDIFVKKIINIYKKEWWKYSAQETNNFDVKNIWEISRFDWLLSLSKSLRYSNNTKYLETINLWISDWVINNPPYIGLNWKCGQECSIRLIHIIISLIILNQHLKPSNEIINLIEAHLKRIYATTYYAFSQQNNHATSEAVALYLGGSFLRINKGNKYKKFELKGKKLIEKATKKFILDDGTFSQYSLNYQRLMIDTLSIAELWRIKNNLTKFSNSFYKKARLASRWLHVIVSPETGIAPNIGANDGANLLPLTNADYCDYRQSVNLATTLFLNKYSYPQHKESMELLDLLGVPSCVGIMKHEKALTCMNGGFYFFNNSFFISSLNVPIFKFRPSQSDALHFDLIVNGKNVLTDSGTYSYFLENNFSKTKHHNTIEFDNQDQMPKLSTFLYGKWIKKYTFDVINQNSVRSSYTNNKGNFHKRLLQFKEKEIEIKDVFSNFKKTACLRWYLDGDDWSIESNSENRISLKNNNLIQGIKIASNNNFLEFKLKDSSKSTTYNHKEKIQVLEVTFTIASEVITSIKI